MAHNNRHDASQTGESSSRPSRSGQPAQAPVYAAIRPRGDPDEHRQAMAEEMEQEHNQALSVRRRKNASSAARMRERQREKEQTLIRRQRELAARERQLTAELATLRAQREQYEAQTAGSNYDELLRQLSSELHETSAAMRRVSEDVEGLLELVNSLDV